MCPGSTTSGCRASSTMPAAPSASSGRPRSRRALAHVARGARVRRRVSARDPRAFLWPSVAAFAVGFSALSIGRQRAFNTGRFDLGNMTQAVWSTAHGHFLEVTNLAGEQTSRLGSHFDPILAALAPAWLVWPSPDMLLVVQSLGVALGAPPVFWLA